MSVGPVSDPNFLHLSFQIPDEPPIVEAVFASLGPLIWVQVSKSEINTSTINLCSPLRRVRDGAPSTCKPNSATLWFQLVLFSLKGVFNIYIYHVTHVYNITFP
ncbi:hypothetical protein AMECASPLE_014353 [Ameca splendens]|uniref:Uncharacterized protein n=1 Tax=Ameca splendens TaxID=208324 RepID=A0ABV0XQH1_9TELE